MQMGKLASVAAALSVLGAALTAGSAIGASCPTIEVAAVAPHGEPGAQVIPIRGGGSVGVHSPPLVSTRDVVDASASSADGTPGLNVRVGADAAERVRAYTAGHVGDRLAFLVDGHAQMVLTIRDPITGDGFWISPMDPGAAKQMVSALQVCGLNPSH
jgi:preprotein translocase subunit SecD